MTDGEFRSRYGPVALVTGASSGIGEAFAERLAGRGMDLVLVARRADRLEAIASRLEGERGVRVTACPTDLAQPDATRRILDATTSLDIGLVVSNAGYGMKGDHAGHDADALAAMLAVNCTMPMLLANGFTPRLRARGGGGLLFVGSVEGLIGCPFSTAYSASKAFVKSLGEGLWGELAPEGIDVLTVCPGATDTEALARAGIDRAAMPNLMAPDAVAEHALASMALGPTLIPSAHYAAMFDALLAMPRRDALAAMAARMRG